MNAIDSLFLAILLTTTLYVVLFPIRPTWQLRVLSGLLSTLASIQFLWQGFYWQYLPSYLLILYLLIKSWSTKQSTVPFTLIHRLILSLLAVMSFAPWCLFLPIPELTQPEGTYAVGSRTFRWVDHDRPEQLTDNPSDKRNIIVQAWYPTETASKSIYSPYIDGLNNLPPKIGVIPSFVFQHYDQINTYGIANAAIAKAQNKWPVIIFLTGNGSARAFYTSLLAGLASYGYIVLAIDHPYEAMITELANGEFATTIEKHIPGDPNLLGLMKNRLDTRIADIQFLIDQLSKRSSLPGNFFSSFDLNRIGAAGHSLGGATAAAAMASDLRIKAAVNIDGTLYGNLPKPTGHRPFLLIESNKSEKDRYVRYESGNQLLFNQFGGGYRYELADADHYSFTDVPLLLAPPARFLAGYILQVGQLPAQTHTATIKLLNAFFDHTLTGKPSTLDIIAKQYKGIEHRPVN